MNGFLTLVGALAVTLILIAIWVFTKAVALPNQKTFKLNLNF
jgi:hypothetical protein